MSISAWSSVPNIALAPSGILAYTIPGRAMLRDKAILAHLVRFYRDHRLFWRPEPNPYGQTLSLGARRERKTESTQAADELNNVLTSRTNLLPQRRSDPLAIPCLSQPMIRLRGREIDWDLFRQEAAQHGVNLAGCMVAPTSLQSEGGQLPSLAASHQLVQIRHPRSRYYLLD